MIKIKCRHHGDEHMVQKEDFRKLIDLLGGLGPHPKAHCVIIFDCDGQTPMEDLEGRALDATEERVLNAKTLKDLV